MGQEIGRFNVSDEMRQKIRDCVRIKLPEIGGAIPVKWLLQSEPPEQVDEYSELDMENIIFSNEFLCTSGYFREMCTLNEEEIVKIADKTVGQYSNTMYCVLKKFRITASNFGRIISAFRRRTYAPSLFKRLLGAYNGGKVSLRTVEYL